MKKSDADQLEEWGFPHTAAYVREAERVASRGSGRAVVWRCFSAFVTWYTTASLTFYVMIYFLAAARNQPAMMADCLLRGGCHLAGAAAAWQLDAWLEKLNGRKETDG